jgi:hypothetical protein
MVNILRWNNMENKIFEIEEKNQKIIYAKMVIALFKSLYKDKKITADEYELLVKEINRTFNLN